MEQVLQLEKVRDEHSKKQLQTKSLELQLAEARLQQQTELAQQESAKCRAIQGRLTESAEIEVQLRQQLNGMHVTQRSSKLIFTFCRLHRQNVFRAIHFATFE